jgi:hypothetical protein
MAAWDRPVAYKFPARGRARLSPFLAQGRQRRLTPYGLM